MATDSLRVAFGIVMVALAALYALPQWLRVRRTGSVEGVSLAATSNALVSCTAWVLFAMLLGDVWVLLTCLAALPSLGATTSILVRNHASRSGLWTTWAWTAALLAGALAYPWSAAPISVLLGCSILWYVAPAAVMAWTSSDVSGIASGAWFVLLADATVWMLYSLLARLPAGILYAIIAGAGALAVLARLAWRRGPDCATCGPRARCTCAVVVT